MQRTIRRGMVGVTLTLLAVWPVRAQIVVHDPAVTLRNSLTAALEDALSAVQQDQRQQVSQMARRLSLFTTLEKYALTDTPAWRIHIFLDAPEEPVLFARNYHAALNYGDGSGSAYLGVTDPLLPIDEQDIANGLNT